MKKKFMGKKKFIYGGIYLILAIQRGLATFAVYKENQVD